MGWRAAGAEVERVPCRLPPSASAPRRVACDIARFGTSRGSARRRAGRREHSAPDGDGSPPWRQDEVELAGGAVSTAPPALRVTPPSCGRPGRSAASIWRTVPSMTPLLVRVALEQRLHEVLRLLEGDVRRQRRNLGIGLHLQHHRPLARPAPRPRPRQLRPGVDVDALSGRSVRRSCGTATLGMSCEASNFGSPSITRCSQVTWLRSSLFKTQTIQRGSAHCASIWPR